MKKKDIVKEMFIEHLKQDAKDKFTEQNASVYMRVAMKLIRKRKTWFGYWFKTKEEEVLNLATIILLHDFEKEWKRRLVQLRKSLK